MKHFVNYPFDYLIYPAVMLWLGYWWGGLIMTILSMILNLVIIRLYDWSGKDWLLIETLKEIREETSKGKWKQFINKLLQKNDLLAFFVLCFDDPITVVLYMRHGAHRYNGMSARDWKIFLYATVVANLYWIIGWTAVIESVRRFIK